MSSLRPWPTLALALVFLLGGCDAEPEGPAPERATTAELAIDLADADPEVRRAAVDGLASWGSSAREQVSALIHLLQADGDERVRASAVQALVRVDPGAEAVVAAVVAALSDESRIVQTHAAYALVSLESAAVVGVPRLVELLASEDEGLRGTSSSVLVLIGDPALPALAEARAGTNDALRQRAAQTVVAIRAQAMFASFQTSDEALQTAAVAVVAAEGPAAIAALERVLLREGLAHEVYRSAVEGLGDLGEPARLALERALRQPQFKNYPSSHNGYARKLRDQTVRTAAGAALGRLGSEESVGRLITALSDDTFSVRSAAARSLGAIGSATDEAVSTLNSMLKRHDTPGYALDPIPAAQALGLLGPAACEAIPALAEQLAHEQLSHRLAAIVALGRMAPASSVVRDRLASLRKGSTGEQRVRLLVALARIDAAGSPLLEQAAVTEPNGIPDAAWSALTRILDAAVADPDGGVERLAEDAAYARALAGAHDDAEVQRAAAAVTKVLQR